MSTQVITEPPPAAAELERTEHPHVPLWPGESLIGMCTCCGILLLRILV